MSLKSTTSRLRVSAQNRKLLVRRRPLWWMPTVRLKSIGPRQTVLHCRSLCGAVQLRVRVSPATWSHNVLGVSAKRGCLAAPPDQGPHPSPLAG